jgi:predicted secreted acid phosphatase
MANVIWTSGTPDNAAAVAIVSAQRALNMGTRLPPAAIFDIDETLLRNRGDDRVSVQPVGRKMFEWATKNNVAIFLLTARRKSPDAFAYAKKQLSALGYDLSAVRKTYMVSRAYDGDNDAGARFKRNIRRRIASSHSIVLNAGDRWGDVTLSDQPPTNAPNRNVYMGVVSGESGVLQGIKFPEVD